jgi:DNA-binding NarL/FixJ family response regulator
LNDHRRGVGSEPAEAGALRPGVVVVDRLPLVRAGMAAALGSMEVNEARSPADGVEVVRRHGARVLVLGDATVEEAGQVLAELQAYDVQVVVLLAKASRDDIVQLLSGGVAGLVLRSTTAPELRAAVETVLSGQRAVGPVFVPLLVGFDAEASHPDAARGVGEATAWGLGEPAEGLLTHKEREVLTRLAQGATNQQIAAALFVTPATVKTHLAHIYAKLEVTDRHEAVSRGVSLGLLH